MNIEYERNKEVAYANCRGANRQQRRNIAKEVRIVKRHLLKIENNFLSEISELGKFDSDVSDHFYNADYCYAYLRHLDVWRTEVERLKGEHPNPHISAQRSLKFTTINETYFRDYYQPIVIDQLGF